MSVLYVVCLSLFYVLMNSFNYMTVVNGFLNEFKKKNTFVAGDSFICISLAVTQSARQIQI